MIKFNSKNHEIEYPPSPMDQFDLNLTSFKLSYASQAPSGPARLRWENLIGHPKNINSVRLFACVTQSSLN